MKIAILGSVSTVIPPGGQAAIERLAYQQAMGLASRGHHILFFALAGSKVTHSNITLIEVGKGETRSGVGDEEVAGEELYGVSYRMRLELVNLASVIENLVRFQSEYEVILNNLRGEAVLLPVAREVKKPFYHILHLPIFPELADLFRHYNTKLISISHAQQKINPDLSYAGTVYNAVDTTEFAFNPTPKEYALYLGSIGRNKNPHEAILAAKKARVPIMIGGRIKDAAYYEKEISPHIDGKNVIWVGEKHPNEIVKLYQEAKVFLFPTKWNEPFGLVAIEAMSCGTPVIAYPNGALPEIIQNGVNGYLVDSAESMAEKIKQIGQIDRATCRKHVEENFSVDKMVDGYEKILSPKL